MAKTTITQAEIQAELERLAKANESNLADFKTTREWQMEFNCSEDRIQRLIRRASDSGLLQVARAMRRNVIGVTVLVPVYRFVLRTTIKTTRTTKTTNRKAK